MDRLCKIRDLQRAVMRFEADFEAHYGISLNEGMTLCTLSGSERMCPGELGEALGLTPLEHVEGAPHGRIERVGRA